MADRDEQGAALKRLVSTETLSLKSTSRLVSTETLQLKSTSRRSQPHTSPENHSSDSPSTTEFSRSCSPLLPVDSSEKPAKRQRTTGEIIPEIPADLFSPEERVVLTANGELQRFISSYYNAAVSVRVVRNHKTGEGEYDRVVELKLPGRVFGIAESTVSLSRPELIDAVENKGVAIGQLFRHFEILPKFELESFQKEQDGRFERTYWLRGEGVSCRIREKFAAGLFEHKLEPQQEAGDVSGDKKATLAGASASFGDIKAGNRTGLILQDGFEPMQRVLLTANGTSQRILRSYHGCPVEVNVLSSHKNDEGGYERQICMTCRGTKVLSARSFIHITAPAWRQALEAGVDVGDLFNHMGVRPTFCLHSVGGTEDTPYLWRVYSLRSPGMVCEIHESISKEACVVKTETDENESPAHVY